MDHLDSVTRLRNEWNLLTDEADTPGPAPSNKSTQSRSSTEKTSSEQSSLLAHHPNIVKPIAWEMLPDFGGMMTLYDNEVGIVTAREFFLPEQAAAAESEAAITPHDSVRQAVKYVKQQTPQDLIAILLAIVGVVEVLETTRGMNIVHHSINPFSIGVMENGESKLGGWHFFQKVESDSRGQARGLLKENPAPLQYIAPECTGRMNQDMDFRSDLYSLGITMYELFVGSLPFRSLEPMELIHQHIAQDVPEPHKINPTVPRAISDTIIKLLQKNPEDRYQSPQALLADIKELKASLEANGLAGVKDFVPGVVDELAQFKILDNLYGRDYVTKPIIDCYSKISMSGGSALVMLRGPSGVGKSKVVNKLADPIHERNGYFAQGKFDVFKQGISFSIIETLQFLIRQVLAGGAGELEQLRKDVIEALEDDAAALIDVIPEVKIILGNNYKVKPMPALGPVESENRFRAVLTDFVAIFARKNLVMFLDDLQWSSNSDFSLISSLLSEAQRQQRLLIIGAYRDNDINANHGLPAMIKEVRSKGIEVLEFELGPLSIEDVRRLIADTLHRDPSETDPELQTLTELVFAKTDGNPFFVTQILQSLYRSGFINFDFNKRIWRFHLQKIQAEDLPATVVDLLVKQILRLPKSTQGLLKVGACAGVNTFAMERLALVLQMKVQKVANDLKPAVDAGLILPVVASGNQITQTTEERTLYRFLHERVQQASYSLLTEAERPTTHRLIGLRLLEGIQEAERESMLIEITNQLNNWRRPLQTDERIALINLNLRAGKKCLRTTSFHTALGYFLIAKELLDDEHSEAAAVATKNLVIKGSKKKRPSLLNESNITSSTKQLTTSSLKYPPLSPVALDVYLSLIDGHFAQNNYKKCIEIVEELLPRCTRPLEKGKCLSQKMTCLQAQGKYQKTIETGFEAMSILGYEVNMDDEAAAAYAETLKPSTLLAIEKIRNIPETKKMLDEEHLLLQEIMSVLILPVYMARPGLLPALCYTSTTLTLNHGISAAGAYPLLMTGVLFGAEGDREGLLRSAAYGKAAVQISEAYGLSPASPAIYQVYAGHIAVFHEDNMNEVLRLLGLAVSTGEEVYNVDYTGFACVEIPLYSMFSGENLNSVYSKLVATKPVIARLDQKLMDYWLGMPLQFVINLRSSDKENEPLNFEGEGLGDAEAIADLANSESISHCYLYHMYRMIMAVYFLDFDLAIKLAVDELEPRYAGMRGSYYVALVCFYASLAFMNSRVPLDSFQQKLLQRNIRDLREISLTAPKIWAHKMALLDAKLSRKDEGQMFRTLDLFDEAIAMANEVQCVNEAALANEICGKWLVTLSKRRALPYLYEAHRNYVLWGAQAKARNLAETFPELANSKSFYEVLINAFVPYMA
jgi:osomolarity two-component system, sensor histidine kinase CHK1